MEQPNINPPALKNGETLPPIEAPEGERAHVLIVDDNPTKLTALAAIVSGMGLNVVTASSGREALRWLLMQDFALILLDVRMPTLDGYETAQLIHSRPRSAYTPIIFITVEALTDEERLKGYTTGGSVDWIVSPIMPEILQAKIKVFVDLFYLNRIALRQAEELKAHNDRLEREITFMARPQPPESVAGKAAPELSLNEAGPDVFGKLVGEYSDLLDHAVERQAYKVVYDISGKLQAMAKEMTALKAWPRDVVEVHNRALQMKIGSMKPELKWAYIEEGRLMVLELMGHLANGYRGK